MFKSRTGDVMPIQHRLANICHRFRDKLNDREGQPASTNTVIVFILDDC